MKTFNILSMQDLTNFHSRHAEPRPFFHSHTLQPIQSSELNHDSDDDEYPDWLARKSEMAIDVVIHLKSEKEKLFFKLWNSFIRQRRGTVRGDCHLPMACVDFLQHNRHEIVHHKLQINFLLHLINLCNFGILHRDQVIFLTDCLKA